MLAKRCLSLCLVHKASAGVWDIVFALADLHFYFQYRRDERLPRPEHIMGENKHTSNGKHVCVWDETASLIWKVWNIDLSVLPRSITPVRTRRGKETADPRQQFSVRTHKLPIWPLWSWFMQRPVSDSDISIHSQSPFSCLHAWAHTQRQRPWEVE